ANAVRLGAPRLDLRSARAPEGLADLPAPDAVFIGGGLSAAVAEAALAALKPFGRLVAHARTPRAESLLAALQGRHGGELTRIALSRATPGGRPEPPMPPVTQWSLQC